MIDILYNIDVALFYFFNKTLANPFFDIVMPFITTETNWVLLWIFAWFLLLFKGGKHRVILAFSVLTLVLLTDQFSSGVLKDLVGRVRPCNVLFNINLLVGCTSSGSFPSSHAVNNFAVAAFIVYFYRNLKWLMYSIATVLALSRVFVGVHYPSDIIGGAILGFIFGMSFALIIEKILVIIESKMEHS